MFRRIEAKSPRQVASEWDQLAPLRLRQITDGTDVTYNYVLIPTILEFLRRRPAQRILDAGCGVGILTEKLTSAATEVVGIDPSANSIAIARKLKTSAATYVHASLEGFAAKRVGSFDVVVANMVLMDVLDLAGFLAAASRVLCNDGQFVFTLTHPWFWPQYCGYSSEAWFRYNEQFLVEGNFRISNDKGAAPISTHVHRPLDVYINELTTVHLQISSLRELMPSSEVEAKYPEHWQFPRYLAGICTKMIS